jgi:hypothetical protein
MRGINVKMFLKNIFISISPPASSTSSALESTVKTEEPILAALNPSEEQHNY